MGVVASVLPADGRARRDVHRRWREGVVDDADDRCTRRALAGCRRRWRRGRRRWRWRRWRRRTGRRRRGRWGRWRPAATNHEVLLHQADMRVALVHGGTGLELDGPGLMAHAAYSGEAVRRRRACQERGAVEVEVVEGRVVVDLDRVCAGRNPVKLVDQLAIGIPQLDEVVVLDVSGENGKRRGRGGAARKRLPAHEHADRGRKRRSGYVSSLHSPSSRVQANPLVSYAKGG